MEEDKKAEGVRDAGDGRVDVFIHVHIPVCQAAFPRVVFLQTMHAFFHAIDHVQWMVAHGVCSRHSTAGCRQTRLPLGLR